MSKTKRLIVVVRCPVCRSTVCNGGYRHRHSARDKREQFNTITEFALEGLRAEREPHTQE